MGLNYRAALRTAGIAAAAAGAAMLPALIASLIYGESGEALAFALCAAVTLPAALLILLGSGRRAAEDLKHRDVMLVLVIWWLFSSFAGAFPYLACGTLHSFADAFFESASGFTTTGATVIADLESLPRGMLLWRSLTGWIGGLAFLSAALAALPVIALAQHSGQPEASALPHEKLPSRPAETAKQLCTLYPALSLLLLILLALSGMRPFDALIHALGALSTSGFSNYSDGLARFDAAPRWILSAFMLLAAFSFTIYPRALSRRWRLILRDEELRWLLILCLGAALLMAARLITAAPSEPAALSAPAAGAVGDAGGVTGSAADGLTGGFADSVGAAVFESAATLSTTGYRNADYTLWPPFCQVLLLILMIVGGCAGSAAGGLKVTRVVVLFKLIHRNILRRVHPSAVVPIKFDGRTASPDTISAFAGQALLYALVFAAGTLLVSLGGSDLTTSMSAVLSCLGNAGPGFGQAGPMETWAFFSRPVKLLLSFLMIAGRLELMTMILLFTPRYWSNDR